MEQSSAPATSAPAASAPAASAPATPAPAVSPTLLLATLASLVVIVVANNSMGALAQPEIRREFGAGPADVGWVVFGFTAAFAVATALWGALGRRFGIGRGLVVGIILLSLASVAAAVATDLALLVAARVTQGLGAGAIPTLGTALVGARFAGPRRAAALGTIIAGVGLGLAVGPILGGVLIDAFGWRAVVGFSLVGAPALLVVLRADPAPGDQGARVDLAGALLVGLAALSAVLLLNRLPVVGITLLTALAVAVFAVALGGTAWHSVVRGGRFLPREVLLAPAFGRLVVLGALGMSAFVGALVIVPIAVADAQGLGGLELGLLLVPMALTAALLSPNNGRVTRRLGRLAATRISLTMLAIGPLLLGLIGASAAPAAIAAALVPLGVGFGLLNAPLLDELMENFDGPLAPVAVGSYNLLYFLGGSLGAALATALVQRQVELPLLSAVVGSGYPTVGLLLALVPAAAALLVARGRGP